MMRRVLITGADGFVASHLIRELAESAGASITGIGLREIPPDVASLMEYLVLDLTDYEAVKELLADRRPDEIFHLAALPSVAASWDDPWSTYRVNVLAQVNLMEALRRLGMEASVHIACSSEEYGKVKAGEMPLGEETPLRPCSHYAVSKVAQETLGLMYHEAFGWRIMVTRGFNQAGPGQSSDFVVSSFACQIAEIEAGRREPVIMVGNLEPRRDFIDVRDTVRAYRIIMESGRGGASYNVCSGTAVAVSEILDMMLEMSEARIRVEPDPGRQRPSDIPLLLGDNTLLMEETGWAPEIPLRRTLQDTIDYWRRECSRGA